jgi:hypothetical protein
MKSQKEISKSQFDDSTVNDTQDTLQAQVVVQESSSSMLQTQIRNSQEMKGMESCDHEQKPEVVDDEISHEYRTSDATQQVIYKNQ